MTDCRAQYLTDESGNYFRFTYPIPCALLFIALAAATVPARAQELHRKAYREGSHWVEETTGTLAAAKNLLVRTSGSIAIHGGSQAIAYTVRKEVKASSEVKARLMFAALRVSPRVKGDTATLVAGSRVARGNVDITLSVPRQVGLVRANSMGADIEVTGIAGQVEAATRGGRLRLDDIGGSATGVTGGEGVAVGKVGGDIDLRTGGGDIFIDSAGRNLVARTGGGDVTVLASRGNVDIESGGGSIGVRQASGNLRASTDGGSIDVGDIGGTVTVETGGGSIHLASGRGGGVRAETGSGTIQCFQLAHGLVAESGSGGITAEFVGRAGDFTDSQLATSIGDIVVYLPADLAVTVQAAIAMANGHRIMSEFPDVKVASAAGDYGPRAIFAQGAIHGGGPTLKIETTAGNIELRRLKR